MKNTEKLYQQFDLYNELIFDGDVPYCEIIIKNKLPKKSMGLFYAEFDEQGNKTYRIELSKAYDNIGVTLIHEMIHALQWRLDYPVNHGQYFKSWRRWIRHEFGLDV